MKFQDTYQHFSICNVFANKIIKYEKRKVGGKKGQQKGKKKKKTYTLKINHRITEL